MSNALVDLRFTLDIPRHIVEDLARRADDGSHEWTDDAHDAVLTAVTDDPSRWLEYANVDYEIEVTV